MKFLISNDDGYDAPGLELLKSVAAESGDVISVAPDRHLSGCAHQVTTDRELTLSPQDENNFALDGTPADCVRIGLHHVHRDADWVLSGLNDGGNLGSDIYLSGTVAAAREAVMLGKPAIAFSLFKRNRPADWTSPRLRSSLALVFNELMQRELPPGHLWNVNLPDVIDCKSDPQIIDCPLERGHLPVHYHIKGRQFRYVVGKYVERPQQPGSDVAVCFGGNIAVTLLEVFPQLRPAPPIVD
ncbi:5'/3'-nucleotidase SurE [Calycomorphotria hydatis]|uniref:5'-nucleotidase n=1 Tax=Calycomorphotria hydatis TaxID=2528027 RepID=A0A517T6G5_9PLAN|nr:5'/3'-nucleotidase SurE [Calycomorphotria hydatis]QDT63951.1 5'-nucleotidase SurE [Calycomorphotria hydatis]